MAATFEAFSGGFAALCAGASGINAKQCLRCDVPCIEVLRTREGELRLTRGAAIAAEASFAAVWENDEDAAYDRI